MNDLPENSNSAVAELDTLDYLRGIKSSTCLLLSTTPSPTPLDLKHPLSEEINEETFLNLNDDQHTDILQGSDALGGDSSSSADSNSVVQDPVSAQLINNISMLDYQTLSKNGDIIIGQDEDCKLNGSISINKKKLPSFVNWNWPLIRKILLWFVSSLLVACIGAIIAMVYTIPTDCNPDLPWYQGKVFYEIFPASFKDSNNDGTGDIRGIIKKLDYIKDLGASAIRLNYIFEAENYPDHYYNSSSLTKIDKSIGVLTDFTELVTAVHEKDMYLILDIPVLSMATPISTPNTNLTHTILLANDSLISYYDPTSASIAYWARAQNVDGFYLRNLEKFVDDVNFGRTLQIWKQIVGNDKIFIASEETYLNATGGALNVLLSRVDLIDVHLDMKDDISGLKKTIDGILKSPLWSKPHYSWVHWNIGNIHSARISSNNLNNTLALTVLEYVLPGTVSIFYGDEIGLGDIDEREIEKDFHGHEHVHNLVPMTFSDVDESDKGGVLSWNSPSQLKPKYHFLDVIKKLSELRAQTPTIYLRGIFKEGNIVPNTKIRDTKENLLIIERWYRRRYSCVFVGNLGSTSITTDLSTMFYGGTVVAGTDPLLIGQVLYFEHITFPPYSAFILQLGK